jgi:hypothetical protein
MYDIEIIQPFLRNLCNSKLFPALKRWAIFVCASGAKKNLRESAKSADAFRIQPAVLAPVAADPWLKNFS